MVLSDETVPKFLLTSMAGGARLLVESDSIDALEVDPPRIGGRCLIEPGQKEGGLTSGE